MLAHECLISKLVGDLSVRSPRDLATTLVLLPTKRLELNLAAHLTMAKSGTAVLPQTKSWNLFLSECIAPTKSKSLVMVSSLLELTMKDFLSNHTSTSGNEPNQISSEHAHELVHLMAELWRNNARHSAQLLIKEWLERLWHLSDEVKIDLDKRVERVFSSLNQFEAHLLASGYQTTEAQQAQAIESSLLTMQEICTRLPYKRIIIAGLTSLPKIEIMFLNQLVAEAPSQNISIESWIHQPWRDLSVHAPLRLLSQAKTDAESPKLNISRMIQCKDPVDEMAFAIDHAMSKIDAGMPPSQLIIAVPDESIYQSIARSLMSLLPVTANIPLAKDLNATNSGRWFAQLIDLLKLKSSESFVRLAKHQDWSRIFKLPVLNENQVRHETQLEYWLQFAPNTIGDLDKTSLKTLQNDQVKELILNFDRGFINEYFFNQNSQKLDWAELQTWWQKAIQEPVERFLNQTKSIFDAQNQLPLVERLAWESVLTAAKTLFLLSQQNLLSKEPKQLASYLEDILAVARSTSLRDIGEPLAGLQILSLTEARFVPSECLILVGCAEGIFPHSLPKDKLIDNSMLSAAKISGWRELEALEDTTFTLLASRIQDVIVTTPSNDGNGVRTKSRWLERLEIQGFKSESSPSLPSSLDKLLGFSKNPEEFSLDRPGLSLKDSSRQTDPDLEGILEDPIQHLKHFSASSLKAFLACPYQYLLRSKKVQSFELRDEDHPINLGSFAHKVIEYTLSTSHDHLINNDPIFATLPSSISHGHRAMFHEAALKRLRLFSSKVFPLDLQDTPFVLELMNSGWVAISDHWSSLFESGWNPKDSVSELTFGRNTDRVVCLEIGSHKVLITGAIDNFYQSPQGDWQINDYKLGKAPERSEVAKGLEPQLVLYSLCIDQLTGTSSNPSIQPSRGVLTYWSLGERTSKTIAVGKELDPALAAIFGKSKSSLEDLQSSLKQKWTEKIDNVISMGRFAADPSHCGYCEYENICRKNDPRHLDRILTQVGVES